MKLYPKCHTYWEIDGEKIENKRIQGTAYTSTGYLLPCCWCDTADQKDLKQIQMYGFYEPDLKVSNVDSIREDILKSPEWYHFHETLRTNPTAAPDICKNKCGEDETIL